MADAAATTPECLDEGNIPPAVAALRKYMADREHIRTVADNHWIPYRIAWNPDEIFATKDACVTYAIQQELFPRVMIIWVGHEEFLDPNPKPAFGYSGGDAHSSI